MKEWNRNTVSSPAGKTSAPLNHNAIISLLVCAARRFSLVALLLAVSVASSGTQAYAQAPQIFFSDLDSGPNAGGESVSGFAGAYVTLYGNFFGASQGSST